MGSAWKAMADPTRRQMLTLLRQGDLTAGELAEQFDISKATISHHLKELREAGLITQRKQGMHVICSLNTSVLEDLMAFIAALAGDNDQDENG